MNKKRFRTTLKKFNKKGFCVHCHRKIKVWIRIDLEKAKKNLYKHGMIDLLDKCLYENCYNRYYQILKKRKTQRSK